jgi:hypothetical protein
MGAQRSECEISSCLDYKKTERISVEATPGTAAATNVNTRSATLYVILYIQFSFSFTPKQYAAKYTLWLCFCWYLLCTYNVCRIVEIDKIHRNVIKGANGLTFEIDPFRLAFTTTQSQAVFIVLN